MGGVPSRHVQSILKMRMVTVQVNGNQMAGVCENHFGTEPTFAWDDGNLLIKTYYPMPEAVGCSHLLEGRQ